MVINRSFMPADRYLFDLRLCPYAKGWAQFDTTQDASYYGNWVNPTSLRIMSYAEGDVTETICASVEEFVAEVRRMAEFHHSSGGRLGRIDPGFGEEMKARFVEIGLGDVLH